jgi:hypothetical protein
LFSACTRTTPATTPIPTVIPFSTLQLDNQIIQLNDLPAGCSGGQITYDRNLSYFFNKYDTPTPDYFISEQIDCGQSVDGRIQIFLYENINSTTKAYQNISTFYKGKSLYAESTLSAPKLGDEAIGVISSFNEPDLVFRFCHAVITIDLVDSLPSTIAYAQRLNKRLSPVVCR